MQESRAQNLQKLKFSQISQAQANSTIQKDMAKKVIKSQRVMQQQSKHHTKSFSNS
jgi:hypothetical protein